MLTVRTDLALLTLHHLFLSLVFPILIFPVLNASCAPLFFFIPAFLISDGNESTKTIDFRRELLILLAKFLPVGLQKNE